MNHLPMFWFVVTVLLCGIEASTMALTTIWMACSTFLMIFLSMLPIPFVAQVVAVAVLSLLFLIFTRPLVKKYLSRKEK